MKIIFQIRENHGCYQIFGNFENGVNVIGWVINGGDFDYTNYGCPIRLFKLIDWKLKKL